MDLSLMQLLRAGGFTMIALALCSLVAWAVIFERLYRFWKVSQELKTFQLEATNSLLRADRESLRVLCAKYPHLPVAQCLDVALKRIAAPEPEVRNHWREAVERTRQLSSNSLKSYLWILGTIGSAAPFIGLFGTVVGILRSFHQMSVQGTGGFATVASGISEALVATASGIIVAVVAVMAYNSFQVRWANLTMVIRLQVEELKELLAAKFAGGNSGT